MSGIKTIKKWIVPILMLVFYGILREKMVHYIINYRSADFSKSLLIGDFVISILLVLLIKLIFKGKFNSIDRSKKMSLKKSVLISVATVFVCIIIMFFINKSLLFVFNPNNIISGNTINIISSIRKNPLPIIGLSFVTSTLEEIVYRQMLFGYLYDLHKGCNKYIRFITSALISSVVFGIVHDGFFHPAMFQYVTAGIILSGLYLYTKRLSSSIIVHILYNLYLNLKFLLWYV